MSAVTPVGPVPDAADCLLTALMYSTVSNATTVLALVQDDDVDPPLNTVLSAIRTLAGRGVVPAPQLVLDELRRMGSLTRQVAVTLAAATTTGACSSAVQHYAAAVVAGSLRRHVAAAGAALTGVASIAAEGDLSPLVERAATTVRDCATRLAVLRCEEVDEYLAAADHFSGEG